MKSLSIISFSLASVLALGCATPDGGDGDPTTEIDSSEIVRDNKTSAVTWKHRRHQGWGSLVFDVKVSGSISVELVGDAEPLAGSDATSQAAIVSMNAPNLDTPDNKPTGMIERQFYVRLVASKGEDGSRSYSTKSGVIIDSSLPSAKAEFDKTYDREARKHVGKTVRVPEDHAAPSFNFVVDAAGKLTPVQPFGLSTPVRVLNFAYCNDIVTLDSVASE